MAEQRVDGSGTVIGTDGYAPARGRRTLAAASCLSAGMLALLAVALAFIPAHPLGDLFAVIAAVQRTPGVAGTTIVVERFAPVGGASAETTLRVKAWVDDATFADAERLAALDAEIKRTVARTYPGLDRVDGVAVTFRTGASAGAARHTLARTLPPTSARDLAS